MIRHRLKPDLYFRLEPHGGPPLTERAPHEMEIVYLAFILDAFAVVIIFTMSGGGQKKPIVKSDR